jgi:hypothetical protein
MKRLACLMPIAAVLTMEANAQTLERYPRKEPKVQKTANLDKECADARARIGRLHAERRGARDSQRNIPEIDRLGRFVDTRCPPE